MSGAERVGRGHGREAGTRGLRAPGRAVVHVVIPRAHVVLLHLGHLDAHILLDPVL